MSKKISAPKWADALDPLMGKVVTDWEKYGRSASVRIPRFKIKENKTMDAGPQLSEGCIDREIKPQSTLSKLEHELVRLDKRLPQVIKAIEAIKANPGIEDIIRICRGIY